MNAMLKFNFSCLSAATALLLLFCFASTLSAERDFNFNDSQVPLLEPKDEPTHVRYNEDPYAAEMSRCRYSDSEIVLSLVLKSHDWHDLSDNKNAKVLDKLSKFFAIPKEFIVTDSVTKRDLSDMEKSALRKAGINKCHNSQHLGRVNIILGCGTNYFTMTELIAKQIGAQMKDGSIDNITDEKFGWWIIWRRHTKARSQRNRRQVEGSGESDYDDYYDYDEENEDEAAETVTEIPAVTTHAHRHHHGVAKPELNENKLDIAPNSGEETIAVAVAENEVDSTAAQTVGNDAIDEDIVQSVSQLESVITKTIENTKNIKELPVVVEEPNVVGVGVDDVVAGPVAELEKELEKPNTSLLNEFKNEFVQQHTDEVQNNLAAELSTHNPNVNVITSDGVVLSAATTTARINIDAALEQGPSSSTSSLLPLNHKQQNELLDNNLVRASASAHVPNVAEVNESPSSLLPSSSSSSSSLLPTVTVELETTSASSTSSSTASTYPLSTSLANTTPQTSLLSSSSSFHTPSTVSVSMSSAASSLSSSYTSAAAASTTTASTLSQSVTTANAQAKNETEDTTVESGILEASAGVLGSSTPPTSNASESSTTSAQLPTTTTTTTRASIATTTPLASSPAFETTTPTPIYTDYVEPHVENTPPMIRNRLQKYAVTSGKAFSYSVPSDTFYDNEDLTNLRLQLTDADGQELKSTSWLQFNAEKREIYGLPLDDAVSKWQYRLTATDSGNESVTETVAMSVQQHRGVRSVNHEINIAVKINERPTHNIDWQLKLMRAIAVTLGDESTNSIVVREIRQTLQDPNSATFVYFNETLPTSECPEAELNNLVNQQLDAARLSDLVYPILSIKSITGQLVNACQKTHVTKPKPTTSTSKNVPPMPRNQVDRVNATVGHLLIYKVPSDTFYDPNDSELMLTLKTKENNELSPRHWLQFDSKNQEFYGIPKSGDIGSEEYLLVAEDSGGLSANDALVVVVNHAPKRDFSVFFKAYLSIRHEHFNADLQRKFVERITQLFGDQNTNNVQIRSVTTNHDSDSTIVNFYNTTLYKTHNRCPEQEIEAARNVYLMQDHQLRDRVKKALGPELNLTNVQINTLGSCYAQTDITHRDNIQTKSEEPSLKSTFADDYMFTFILPAIIIAVMIIIASLIACCLHRRRHKSGKMELGDEEERKSFRTKGIPVIFQDELDEKPEIGNKSPIILKDEKPPLLPPSYNTSNLHGENDVDEYVPPPAVVVGGREARGKSPATPSYRKPPPYVSP